MSAGDAVIDQAVTTFEKAQDVINGLYDAVNKVLSWVPSMFEHLIEPIQKLMDEFGKRISQWFDTFNQFYFERGSIDNLREAKGKWADVVGKKLGTISGDLALDKHRSNIEWEGRAAEAYKSLVPAQVKAVEGLKGAADRMVLSLDALANALETFWVAVGVMLATFVTGMAAAVAACAGVVTTPAGVAAALGVVAVCVGAIGAAISAVTGAVQQVDSQVAAVKTQVESLAPAWKQTDSGVQMSDGSVSDGDDSNWSVAQ